MEINMGTIDRVIRTIIAIVIAVLFYQGIITGTTGIILLVVAGIFVLTSLFKVCPIYAILGLSTCPYESKKES